MSAIRAPTCFATAGSIASHLRPAAAQELADAGRIAQDEVATHRLRHRLTRSLGTGGGEIEAELQHLPLADGDRVLLCTDGLTDMVPDARIAEVLRGADRTHEACGALVGLALVAGGGDNVTVLLGRYAIPPAPPGVDNAAG